MQISKKPIDDQISWLSSHAAGALQWRELDESQSDFWMTVINVTNEVSSLRRRVSDLEDERLNSGHFRVGGDAFDENGLLIQ